MIPILYDYSYTADYNTAPTFADNGLGRLSECTRCIVTEELNGIFECEFDYPVTGRHYDQLILGKAVVYVTHDDSRQPEPFDVYDMVEDMSGITTFYARHISYRLSGVIMKPVLFESPSEIIAGMNSTSNTYNGFLHHMEFDTDLNLYPTIETKIPTSYRSLLLGSDGILEKFAKLSTAEMEYKYPYVRILEHRGRKTDMVFRYGKSISELRRASSAEECYNAIVPYWYKEQYDVYTALPEGYLPLYDGIPRGEINARPYDLSWISEGTPEDSVLRAAAEDAIDTDPALRAAYGLTETIDVSFVQLWQTPEYKDYAYMQHLLLGDRIDVVFSPLHLILEDMPISKVVYNTLEERYDSMTLGTLEGTFLSSIEKDLGYQEMETHEDQPVNIIEEDGDGETLNPTQE